MHSTTNSFSILVPFATVNRKPRPQPASQQRPLASIIVQNEIREQNLEYQHLLIRRKELEIAVEDHRNQYEALVKRRKRADKTLEQAVAKRDQAQLECKEKRCYLERYYEQLDRKFRGGRDDLFSSLTRLQHSLLQAYEKDEKRLRDSLITEEEEFNRLVTLVGVERERRDRLRDELDSMDEARNRELYGARKSGENDYFELKNENNQKRSELEQLNREKKTLQNEQRILKRIQNVEEEHRKHSAIIQNGIKKMFMNKLKEQRYKAAVSPEYEKSIDRFREIISKKRAERDALQAQVNDKRTRLESIGREINEKNREYGELEDRFFRQQSG